MEIAALRLYNAVRQFPGLQERQSFQVPSTRSTFPVSDPSALLPAIAPQRCPDRSRPGLPVPQGLEAIGAVVLAASEAAVMGKLLTWATNGEVLEALWTKCPTPEGGVLQRSR